MEPDVLVKKAAEIYAAACNPAMQDILYADSLRAEWNDKLQTFHALSIRGIKHNRFYPIRSIKFTVRFLAGDDTSPSAVYKAVAHRMATLDQTKKKIRPARII